MRDPYGRYCYLRVTGEFRYPWRVTVHEWTEEQPLCLERRLFHKSPGQLRNAAVHDVILVPVTRHIPTILSSVNVSPGIEFLSLSLQYMVHSENL